MARIISDNPEAAFRALRAQGATLPSNPVNARLTARRQVGLATGGSLAEDIRSFSPSMGRQSLSSGRSFPMTGYSPKAKAAAEEMERRRTATGPRSDIVLGLPKLRDPLQDFKEKSFWWMSGKDADAERRKLQDWCRLIYCTHPLLPSLIDIYARFPLLEMEFVHKDNLLVDYYSQLFLDALDYKEFLYNVAREHWTVGEVYSLGSWHDGIGAWDDDEIINPNDVVVAKNHALRTYNFHVKVPEEIKKLIETQQPRAEYMTLMELYPDVVAWARQDKEIPVSNVLMKQLKFSTDPWNPRGTPILLRAFTTLQHEMALTAAQDAVADRLLSPLLLAKLGLDNVDEEGPWVPEPAEINALRDDLSVALMSDFRLFCYHHGLDIESVWGRELMPSLDADFERVNRTLMQIFGIGADLLQGGTSGTYASGALNRELVTNLMATYQGSMKKFMHDRMEVVAERQGHYEYEVRGGKRYPIMETVLMLDEETGEEYAESRPKLAIPEVKFKSMNLRDEKVEREFLFELKEHGFPIASSSLAVNIPFTFDEELEKRQEEKLETTIAELRFKDKLFDRIYKEELPVPSDIKGEYENWLDRKGLAELEVDPDDPLGIPKPKVPGGTSGDVEIDDVASDAPAPNIAPTEETGQGRAERSREDKARDRAEMELIRQRPEISDEQRATQPKRTFREAAKEIQEDDYEGRPEFEMRVHYGAMKFGTPEHAKVRRKLTLPPAMARRVFSEAEVEVSIGEFGDWELDSAETESNGQRDGHGLEGESSL